MNNNKNNSKRDLETITIAIVNKNNVLHNINSIMNLSKKNKDNKNSKGKLLMFKKHK